MSKPQINVKMEEILTSNEVVEVLGLNTLAAFTLPNTGIADRFGMGHAPIATERYFPVNEVKVLGCKYFKSDDERVAFYTRMSAMERHVQRLRNGHLNKWMTANEASSRLGTTREWIYQLSDFRGGDKIKTIEFGRIRLFWRNHVDKLVKEKMAAN